MMRTTYPFLFEDEGTLFSHLIMKMNVAYACVCEFQDEILLRGGKCKTREKFLNFQENKGKTVICRYIQVENLEVF